jgi:hypothetical protein
MKKTESRVVVQPNQKGLKFYVNKGQAKKVFDTLITRLSEKGPPYHAAHVPQAQQFLPDNLVCGSKEHAIFLFVLCFWMRGGIESDTASSFLKTMYEQRPDVFVPDAYWDFGPDLTRKQIETITKVLQDHRLGQRVEENAPGWVYNMRKLAQFWSGDPRRLMTDKPQFKKLVRRIVGKTKKNGTFINEDNPHGFMFFREKMTAMIAYFLMDAGLVPMFYTPVPVDFHVLRLLVSNQVIRVRGKSMKETVGIDFMRGTTQRLAREVTEWYCRKYLVSPIALCDSLWLLSRSLCRFNPGNSGYIANNQRKQALQKERSVEDGYPVFNGFEITENEVSESVLTDLAGRKRYLGLAWGHDDLMKPSMVRSFKKSCGVCPLQGSCRYNISAGSYYTGGMLLPERFRFIPPDTQEHFLSHPAFAGSFQAPVDPTVRFTQVSLK